MAMRDLVAGGAVCAVPGSSSSSNPLGALANVLIGSSSKSQERLKEIPTLTSTSDRQFVPEQFDLPGSEFDQPFLQPHAQASEFFNGFRSSADASGLADAWDEIQHPQAPQPALSGFPGVYGRGSGSRTQPTFDGPPQRVLSNFLHSFVGTGRGGIPFHPTALPVLGLSQGDKQCIRDRSSIMARHIFADKSEDFIESQVNALLASLDIDNDALAKGFTPGRFRELEDYWTESQSFRKPIGQFADGWVAEYEQQRLQYGEPEAWAHSFEQQHGAGGWASEFEQEQFQLASMGQMKHANIANLAAMEQTRLLANTLARNEDPNFQNSQFLQFLSKMSQGELNIDGNQVKQTSLYTSGNWASEYQQQYDGGSTWTDEFVSTQSNQWVNEFSKEEQRGPDDQWVNEFSKLNVDEWAEEFRQKVGESALGESSDDNWADSYDEFLNGQKPSKQDASKGIYVFSDMNPYVGHPDPLKEGQELFRKGLLSEAVLALEAEVLKNPENAEGWRLLGVTHAENDDDQQAIAAMMRAQEADPTNLEVLLALGVSHTNELEQAAALKYLYGWLRHHPKLGTLANPDLENTLYYNDIARAFNEAARMMPDDADVHVVLGVLYNLAREFDKAILSFRTALELKPHDYSLWNKLGATKANSIQSADAISAYQKELVNYVGLGLGRLSHVGRKVLKALDLKPNYVRAWANMGISYANQGLYEESVRYYVRALCMNPKADNAWQYLRLSLSCASRNDMFEACDSRNLDALQKEFPL